MKRRRRSSRPHRRHAADAAVRGRRMLRVRSRPSHARRLGGPRRAAQREKACDGLLAVHGIDWRRDPTPQPPLVHHGPGLRLGGSGHVLHRLPVSSGSVSDGLYGEEACWLHLSGG